MGGVKKSSFWEFIGAELTRNYVLEYDEEQYSAVRKKVYQFMKIPWEVEKFMFYGFLQCADSFLFVYTFLPLRFVLAVYGFFSRLFFAAFGYRSKKYLKPAEICDILKITILVICSVVMSYIDTSIVYHLIKSQSVIKLYIFYNLLEVGDRLFSAFGQDIIDALFWTATEPRNSRIGFLRAIFHFICAIIYVFLHSLLVLIQATILNVAFNSSNRALLVIMMSNNFVEIKGSVFKKFDKNNLFQVSCSDVRERFHLLVLLSIVVLLTMKEYAWAEDTFWFMMMDCMVVIVCEVCVDGIKHAFITKFNELPLDVYKDYVYSLAYDIAQTHQKHAFTDHSDLVARRMGFIPLPLGVVILHVLRLVVTTRGIPEYVLLVLGYFCLVSARLLNNILILGKACNYIEQHQKERAPNTAQEHNSIMRRASSTDSATTPTHPSTLSLKKRSISIELSNASNLPSKTDNCPQLRSPAIFSNSNVNINEISLNEEVLKSSPIDDSVDSQKLESIGENDLEYVTRSEPNIQSEIHNDNVEMMSETLSTLSLSDDNLAKKRAESEPSVYHSVPN
ncbi:protein TAPT1 homolog [Planococcus citri]|uniref:protein TAPT1 homolog n=1 Tax=Planococcus citri TaxID=170843 RepID=UPI0031F82A9B